MAKLNKRKCANCSEVFQKKQPLQSVCSYECSIEKARTDRETREQKEWKKRKSKIKESLKTKQDYEKELQYIFNTYIRKRDKDKGCISCEAPLVGKYDAGHYFPVGSYKNLRFNEDNCFGQCVYCNQHKHGNLNEYSLMIPIRIGEDRFNKLNEYRFIERHYSIAELIELKVIYKDKIKVLTKNK